MGKAGWGGAEERDKELAWCTKADAGVVFMCYAEEHTA